MTLETSTRYLYIPEAQTEVVGLSIVKVITSSTSWMNSMKPRVIGDDGWVLEYCYNLWLSLLAECIYIPSNSSGVSVRKSYITEPKFRGRWENRGEYLVVYYLMLGTWPSPNQWNWYMLVSQSCCYSPAILKMPEQPIVKGIPRYMNTHKAITILSKRPPLCPNFL